MGLDNTWFSTPRRRIQQMSKIFLLPRYFSAGVWARCWSQVEVLPKKNVAIQVYWHWLRTVQWIFLDLVMPQLFGIRCLSKANSKLLFRCSWVPKWMTNVPINKNLEKLPLSILQRTSPPFYTHQNLWLMEGTIFLPGWREVWRSKTPSWSGETCSLPFIGRFGERKVRWNPPNPLKVGKQIGNNGVRWEKLADWRYFLDFWLERTKI